MLKFSAPVFALAVLPACTPTPSANAPVPPNPSFERGLVFATNNCSGCHAVGRSGASPNADAPTFSAIANMPGLSGETLRQYLRDSHNDPAAMNFTVEPAEIDDLADYVITLQRPDYKPDI